jgi:hypothetical protein
VPMSGRVACDAFLYNGHARFQRNENAGLIMTLFSQWY